MSSIEQLFGFNTTQKSSLADYVATHGGGGGGGNTLGGLPVTPGFITPLANGQLWVIFQGLDGLFVTNYGSDSLVNGLVQQFLEGLPDWNASVAQSLQHDTSGIIRWVDNA